MKRQWILGTAGIAILAVATVIVGGRGAWAHVSAALASEAVRAPAATLVVTSTADSGPGTLRQALLDAVSGDTITFDPAVFPPGSPVTIALTSGLPEITQGNLTIDASDAGVILDGSGIGTTPETLLLDDVSLALDGGPNVLANGDFSAGPGHWRPWDDRPGATRGLNNSDFHSSPYSYEWNTVAHVIDSRTVYDTTDTSAPADDPFDNSGTAWIAAPGGSTVEFRFWYRGGGVGVTLYALFPDDAYDSDIGDWWFGWQADWTEVVVSETLPVDAIAMGTMFYHDHSQRGVDGLRINSSGNVIQGLQIVRFPNHGILIYGGAQNNVIGGDSTVGDALLGQGNLSSGNGGSGICIRDSSTMGNTVSGNRIGTDVSGTVAIGNGADESVHIIDGASHNLIGGVNATPGGVCSGQCNLISGNDYDGVEIEDGATNNTVSGNYIGTDISGTVAMGNEGVGVRIDGVSHNLIGGDTPGERNLISGNGQDGVQIENSGAMSNIVSGNYIGTNATGTGPLGNTSHGVGIWNGASNNIVGGNMPDERNIIAYNGAQGVAVYGPESLCNTITHNSIHDNDGMGIDLDDGGNAELAAPAITYFDLVAGVARGTACANCTVEVFSDRADEGEVYEGSTTADGAGDFTFDKGAPLAGPHLTATATDADGNTSEFSAPAVPPSISHVVPNQGTNDVPNEINVYGLNFAAGVSVTLGTTPPTDLATWRLSSTHLRATVPAGLPAGTYDLTATNPDGDSDTLANAYTVFDAQVENDDLYAQSHDLWCDPPTVRQGEQASLGLVVHRQGGKVTLSNVVVRFYDGDPDGGGTLIGDGTIYLLSPRSSASTTKVPWNPAVAGDHAIYARIDPDDAISETIETNNTVSTTVTVLPTAGDTTPPVVTSFTINDGAETTAVPTVTLTVSAEDNVGGSGMGSMFFVELEFAQAAMQWVPVQASGWLSYTTRYTWTLVPVAGVRYMQAWAADRAGNISLYPYKDRINYLLPSDRVAMGQVKLYRQYVGTGQTLTVIVSPVSGDPDLYIWPPIEGAPARVSNNSTGVDQVSIVATASGTYQIEIYGYTAAEYMISINVSGGAARPAAGQQAVQSVNADKPSRPEPLIPATNEPLGQMAVPSAPVTGDVQKIYLPLVLKGDLSPAAP